MQSYKWLLLPANLLKLQNPSIESSWIEREHLHCRRVVAVSSIMLSIALLAYLYMDSLRPYFDPYFSFPHRIGGMAIFLGVATLIWLDPFKKYWFGFAVYKLIFILGSLYVAYFQIQLMFINVYLPRMYPQVILVGVIGILNMGLRTNLIVSFLHSLLFILIGLSHSEQWAADNRYISDCSLQTAAILLVYILTSRYSLSVKLHISNFIREEAAKSRADHAYKQLTKLVLPHVVAKINAGYSIEDTMPIGKAEAYVICFDIIGSSQIDHRDFYRKLEKFQALCFEAMNESYNPKTLEGEAYRIKELGDGFLCSMGFPLKFPKGSHPAVLVHKLALRFLDIFDREMASLNLSKPALGGIGIAYGPIEGYFPTSGPRQYDLRDRSITLATRYQELRKLILIQETRTHHAIIISKAVYDRLPDSLKSSYQHFRMGDKRVRDDANADDTYAQLVLPFEAEKISSQAA